MHVRGDSKVVIEWAKGNYDISSVELEHWLSRTKELIKQFSTLTFQHIFREYNTVADDLSKRAIGTGFKEIILQEYSNGSLTDSGALLLY